MILTSVLCLYIYVDIMKIRTDYFVSFRMNLLTNWYFEVSYQYSAAFEHAAGSMYYISCCSRLFCTVYYSLSQPCRTDPFQDRIMSPYSCSYRENGGRGKYRDSSSEVKLR